MPGWSQRPLFKNPTNMTGGGPVGMPKGMSIPGYGQGSVVQGGSMVEEMPAYRQEQLAKETEYQKAIEKTASLFLNPFQGLLRDYDSNLHYFAKNLSGGHQIPKEQVMQDLRKSISAQRKEMPVKEGFMEKARRRFSGVDKASPMSKEMLDADGFETKSEEEVMLDPRRLMPEEEVMLDPRRYLPPEMMHGGIVGLQNGGMMPELFEGEEIVETNPMINEMAGQGGTGIASVSAEPASGAMPERNVPNERGIIELAMDAEEVEDDEPMVAMAKQEAQSLLDQEFNILKSTAKAEAASGNSPSMVIKSGMDDLARSARRIENEVTEKYPEVPANTNLISSDDLIPYREQLVAVFEMPEIGGEEPLMDTSILTAKNGGKIPGYQDGGVADVPEEWSWIDEDIREKGMSLEESEREMIQRYGSDITAMRKILRKDRETSPREKEKIRRGRSLEELANMDTREADLITAMKEMGFETASQPSIFQGRQSRTMDIIKNPEVRKLIDQYRVMGEPLSENKTPIEEIEVTAQKRGLSGEQGSRDQGLSFQGSGQDLVAIMKAGKEAGMSNAEIMQAIKLMQQGDPLADVKRQAETLKGTIKTDLEGMTSVLQGSVTEYEKEAKNRNNKIDDIFEDIERRIPIQAELKGRSAVLMVPGAGTKRRLRKLKEAEFSEDLYQTNNANKIEYEKLRKQEIEARRKQDLDALYEIKLKQAEILSGIDESILGDERAIAKAKVENELAVELERIKIELGTTGQTYGFEASMSQREKSDNFTLDENMTYASRQYGPAQAAERYVELQGEKTFDSGGQSRKMTYPEFYREAYASGKTPKEIVTLWGKAR